MTAGQPHRRNPHLDIDCPPWCAVDHSGEFTDACVGGGGGIEHIWARAVRSHDGAVVAVSASLADLDAEWPHLRLDLRGAESLAAIVELLADATPDQHRELAAAIRQGAADITEAQS
jgi:hypothetical protein